MSFKKIFEKKNSTFEVQLEKSEHLTFSSNLGIKKKSNEKDGIYQNRRKMGKCWNDKDLGSNNKDSPFEFHIDYPNAYKKIEHFKDMYKQKLNELVQAFNLIDFDRDGIINGEDLKKTFASLNQNDITQEDIEQMMAEASQPLDFDSFVILLGRKTLDLEPTEVLIDAFSFWDNERNGCIPHDRILEDIVAFGDKFTEAEAKAALADAPFFFSKSKAKMIEYLQFSEDISGLRKILQRRNILV